MGASCSSSRGSDLSIKKTIEVPGLKIAIVGDPETGKTCILSRYVHCQFSPLYIKTRKVAIENVVRKVNYPAHATVPITFWDIPGKDDLDFYESFFRNLDAVIVVVDSTDNESIESAKLWRNMVISKASFDGDDDDGEGEESEKKRKATESHLESKKLKDISDIPFLLLGSKKDLLRKETETEVIQVEPVQEVTSDLHISKTQDALALLEDVAKQGFVGSVLVSAKSNDLSVHGAIQRFLRHILERNYVERRWKETERPPKAKRPRYEYVPQLKKVGIEKIDEEFAKADEVIYRVRSLHRYQNDSLAKFADQCVEIGVIDSSKDASMQNCLVALRNKLDSLDLKLKLVLVDDFYNLEIKASTEDADLEKSVRYAIKTFNKEYVVVTTAMLTEYPLAKTTLSKIDRRVEALCGQYEILPPSRDNSGSQQQVVTQNDLQATAAAIEENRAIMKHAVHECEDCLSYTHASVKRAKAAFVW